MASLDFCKIVKNLPKLVTMKIFSRFFLLWFSIILKIPLRGSLFHPCKQGESGEVAPMVRGVFKKP
jgi:hypothetical protein